jgi:hypothetical protein
MLYNHSWFLFVCLFILCVCNAKEIVIKCSCMENLQVSHNVIILFLCNSDVYSLLCHVSCFTCRVQDVMMRKKMALHLDSRYETMIENAYFYSNPPDQSLTARVERPPMHNYIRRLLYKDLSKVTTEKVSCNKCCG